jgi:uncharacterized coiled-coil protein SlyX
MNAHRMLTRESIVDELAALLAARRMLGARRNRAYHRLAQRILDSTRASQPHLMPTPASPSLKTAA